MTKLSAKERLVPRASALKRAWILSAAMVRLQVRAEELVIPSYQHWSRRDLETHVADLEHDLCRATAYLQKDRWRKPPAAAVNWLARKCGTWIEEGGGLMTVSTLQEAEGVLGPLRARQVLDSPPYAELLLQPGHGVAFRHPEYMLARDVECLSEAFMDTERLLDRVDWANPPHWAPGASQGSQALARAVVQACFNLVESVTSGLAKAFILENPGASADLRKRLGDTRDSLKKRVLRVPRLITGCVVDLDANKIPMATLFGDIKQRRDAFVHCEPGPGLSERGTEKERLFHDVSVDLVRRTITDTHEIVRAVWRHVHGGNGPVWISTPEASGRFARSSLRMVARTD